MTFIALVQYHLPSQKEVRLLHFADHYVLLLFEGRLILGVLGHSGKEVFPGCHPSVWLPSKW